MGAIDYTLYLVTDRSLSRGRPTVEIVRAAVAGGVTCVQLREKNCGTREFLEEARAVRAALRGTGVPLIVNDRADIALAVGADGVHLGQRDMPIAAARRLGPPGWIIGVSAESVADAVRAEQEGADYVGVSPVFATPTKADHAPPLGLEGLRAIRAAVEIPLVAIGGIHAGNARDAICAGADGLAVVSAIVSADSPREAAAALRDEIAAARNIPVFVKTGTAERGRKRRMAMKTYRRTLTIAGSDSGGGAGIQADLKTFAANGCYGMSVITALTAQNTQGVSGIHAAPVDFVAQQLDAVLSDVGADAVKIGMLFSPELIQTVARKLKEYGVSRIVLDPVMVAQSGDKLLRDDAVEALKTHLIPLAEIVTPNIPEAETLLGRKISGAEEMPAAAEELMRFGCRNALVKGGHLEGEASDDCLYLGGEKRLVRLPGARIETRNNHGTGCTLSSAIAAFLAQGHGMEDAVRKAKEYVSEAIRAGAAYRIGHGHGPVHHFWRWWPESIT